MRFFAVLFFICFTTLTFAQTAKDTIVKVSATVKDDTSLKTLQNVHIINFNTVKGTITNEKGFFEIADIEKEKYSLAAIYFDKSEAIFDSLKIKDTSETLILNKGIAYKLKKTPS